MTYSANAEPTKKTNRPAQTANWGGPGRGRKSTRPEANGVVELKSFEFIDQLADLVPPPRKHRHRYHRVFAPNHKLRRAVTALAIGNFAAARSLQELGAGGRAAVPGKRADEGSEVARVVDAFGADFMPGLAVDDLSAEFEITDHLRLVALSLGVPAIDPSTWTAVS